VNGELLISGNNCFYREIFVWIFEKYYKFEKYIHLIDGKKCIIYSDVGGFIHLFERLGAYKNDFGCIANFDTNKN